MKDGFYEAGYWQVFCLKCQDFGQLHPGFVVEIKGKKKTILRKLLNNSSRIICNLPSKSVKIARENLVRKLNIKICQQLIQLKNIRSTC